MCGCQTKLSGMKRKRIGALKTGGITDIAMQDVLPAVIGYLAGEVIDKQLTFLNNNPMMGNIVKLGGGLFLAAQGNGIINRAGIGLAANGGVSLVLPSLQKANIARLLPPGVPSAYIAAPPMYTPEGARVRMQ